MTEESEVCSLVAFLNRHFPADVEGLSDPEEIGRRMIAISTSGPRLWSGIRILQSLGVLVDPDAGRPS
ncbi:hypothetical protein [Pseudaminobacter sp. NGMCC 1.201702]|uniref:hypothetical protein n=1 Tax=Pseudaminobacter sp. NGMCC 1.201702 TaxID=3391825 RepID=UPI0039F097F8